MNINIVLPYKNISKDYKNFAIEESKIDFRKQLFEATRCTVCFAATELENYLLKIINNLSITVCDEIKNDSFNIVLIYKSILALDDTYTLEPMKNGINIIGETRVGVLYGVYELLKLQGIMWFEPGEVGEYIPPKKDTLELPKETKVYKTSSDICRGFALDGHSNENEELEYWMARNRLNSFYYRANTCKLMKKLGIRIQDGGHIFESLLDPDNVTKNGKTFWEEHYKWYGTPADKNKNKEEAIFTQFCVSQDDLFDYLGEQLINKLNNEYYDSDLINIWGFDTWGSICTCEECQKLGNGTDQALHMISKFREIIDKAVKDKKLDHNVILIPSIYEGTVSIEPPLNPIPKNLLNSGDYILFAPIVRCYAHQFNDKSCSYNKEYSDWLDGWKKISPCMPLAILEYYNVTKFEDLPLLFIKTMQKDFIDYNVRGFQYMHIPMVNWGVRSLTQVMYAELCWNPNANMNEIIEKYFNARYGQQASKMKEIYNLVEEASHYITSFRAWKFKSVLQKLQEWKGNIPSSKLELDDHLINNYEEISASIENNYSKALDLIEEVIEDEKINGNIDFGELDKIVNPIQLLKIKKPKTIRLLLDDKRGLIYGLDTIKMSNRLVEYYNALSERNFELSNKYWAQIEELEKKLESYYIPMTFTSSLVGFISKDALTRTQFDDVIRRVRAYRKNNKEIIGLK